ncbi:MAG: helix-turn-helix transcriptional regulator [Pseudomonadota bacterium]
MTPDEFKAWRKGMGLRQKEAADRLGLRKRMIQYYEKGEREGKAVEIPLTVELACFAVSKHVLTFDGIKAEKLPRSKRTADGTTKSGNRPTSGKPGKKT